MKAIRLSTISAKDLLQLHADITLELRARGVVRTHNNPLGDYTEGLVADALDLELADNSVAGYDGIAKDGTRVQIKGRRITGKSRQLSAIRNLDANEFDVLAAVLFDERFNVTEALLIPREVVAEYASYRAHTNAHVLNAGGTLLTDPRVQRFDVKKEAP